MHYYVLTELPLSPMLQISFLILIVVSLFLIVGVAFASIRDQIKRDEVIKSTNIFRVYSIDLTLNIVWFFNQNQSRGLRKTTIEEFLLQYRPEEHLQIKSWLRNLVDKNKDVPWSLQAEAKIKYSKKSFFTILEVTNVESEKKIIHLNSYLIKYLSPKKTDRNRFFHNVINEQNAEILLNKTPINRGALLLITFFYAKRPENHKGNISSIFLKKIKDKISIFLCQNLYLVEKEDGNIIFLETRKNITKNHMQLAHSMAKEISSHLEVHGLSNELGFSIGLVEHKYFPHNYTQLVEHGKMMADLASRRNMVVSLYDQNQIVSEQKNRQIDIEVNEILINKKYMITYRPIVSTQTYDNFGFFVYVQLLSNISSDRLKFRQLLSDNDLSRELFSTFAKSAATTLIEQRGTTDQKVFFPVSIYERGLILKSLPVLKNVKAANFVLMFDEDEINEWEEEPDAVRSLMNNFKEKGFMVSITFTDMNLLLDNDIYLLFDYYILDQRMTKNIATDDRQRLELRTLIGTLTKFGRPIIATDIDDFVGVELIDNYDITLISAECLAPATEDLQVADKKIIARLRQFEEIKKSQRG